LASPSVAPPPLSSLRRRRCRRPSRRHHYNMWGLQKSNLAERIV
jgi:hypothetical protein